MDKCWCGNTSLEEYSQDYYVCHACGTLVSKSEFDPSATRIHNEDKQLYGSNYWTEKMVQKAEVQNVEELIALYFGGRVPYWIQYIVKYIPFYSSVAEIGCGLGQLSFILKFMGYGQTAYEVSSQICSFLKRNMDLNIVCGEFGCINEIYDAILSFDLLEHLMEPKMFVNECRERLMGKSIFCCQTPCYTEEWSYEDMLKEKPEFSYHLVPEQHIFIFSKRSMTKLLEESGFPYIVFEPPAFGEYYDMFVFSSPFPLASFSEEEMKNEFSKTPNGLFIRIFIDFFKRLSQSN